MDAPDDELRDIATVHDLADVQDPGRIERVEQDGGTVRYRNILMLAPGVWGDAGSGRHIYYSPEGIENSADNWEASTVNLFHERDNEVTDVGDVDTDTVFVDEEGGLYGDIVLHMDNAASQFADDALQNALETDGREGLQGPSVELRGDEYRFNEEYGTHELVEGTFNGLGLVGLGVSPGPGSKDAAFAEQTQERAVALAGTDDPALLTLQDHDQTAMTRDEQIALLAEHGIDLDDDVDDDDVQALMDALELQDEDGEEEDNESESEDGEDGDGGEDGTEEEDDDEDVDINLEEVAGRVDDVAEQVQTNAERIEALAEATEALQQDDVDLAEMSESLSTLAESIDDMADAEAVADLESRLSDIEDEPEESTSLADVGGAEVTDSDEKYLVEMGPNATQKPAFTR
ncbi:hypothetical protein [Halorarum salinum]|uniref:Uncharacterized protein n=1 Tax=Halorarum salinum TaxID=2743089 RepID=A0A7D5QHD5_9EURY|nr:hypothetical protein [Halobaculum salinum]QLG62823.1 hypothetical protein HUG12_14240 [Halobaculum salinum]